MFKITHISKKLSMPVILILICTSYSCVNKFFSEKKENKKYFGLSEQEKRNMAKKWAENYLYKNQPDNIVKNINTELVNHSTSNNIVSNNIENVELDEAWEKLRSKVKRIRIKEKSRPVGNIEEKNMAMEIIYEQVSEPEFEDNEVIFEPENENPENENNEMFVSPQIKNQDEIIIKTLTEWSDSWSSKDIDSYLSFYDVTFKLPKGMTWKAWEKDRRKRLNKKFIEIKLSDIKIVFISDNLASTTFIQDYRSSNYKEKSKKHILFKRTGSEWHIIREQELKSRL